MKKRYRYRLPLSEDAVDGLGSVLMAAISGIFLLAGFLFSAWAVAWVVFPLGGILCGIAECLGRKKQKEEAQ